MILSIYQRGYLCTFVQYLNLKLFENVTFLYFLYILLFSKVLVILTLLKLIYSELVEN